MTEFVCSNTKKTATFSRSKTFPDGSYNVEINGAKICEYEDSSRLSLFFKLLDSEKKGAIYWQTCLLNTTDPSKQRFVESDREIIQGILNSLGMAEGEKLKNEEEFKNKRLKITLAFNTRGSRSVITSCAPVDVAFKTDMSGSTNNQVSSECAPQTDPHDDIPF